MRESKRERERERERGREGKHYNSHGQPSRHWSNGSIDNMKLLLICILQLSHSFIFFRFYFLSMVVFLYNTVIYVFLLLCLHILIVCLCIFIVPAGTLRLPWLSFFRAFSSVAGQMPGYSSQRRGTARTLPKRFVLFYILFVLCRSVYCLCVNVYCTTATGWQPNCSSTNISYIISESVRIKENCLQ
jgi:hypothetical protein